MDWNSDGKKDIVTGENNGNVRIYLNTGTDASPAFNGCTYLKVGGVNFDCGSYSTPHVVDWNNDGKKDVLCGESAGKVWLLINTGTDANPVFNTKVFLQDGASNLTVVYRSAPTVVDWNDDGMKDLISGSMDGYIFYFRNKGTDAEPVFDGSSKLKEGDVVLDAGWTSRPDVVDWDGDGVMDIICGEYVGTVEYYHALGALSLSDNRLYQGTGGAIDFALKAGAENAGRKYFVLGSISGTEPGLPLPGGVVLPLNWDAFTGRVFKAANTPACAYFNDALDGSGNGKAQFNTLGPMPPETVGVPFHFAYLLYGPMDFASNGAEIEVLP